MVQRVFGRASEVTAGALRIVQRKSISLIVYVVLLGAMALLFTRIPRGFVPADSSTVGIAQLPAGASIERTDAVFRRMSDIIESTGIVDSIAFRVIDCRLFCRAQRRHCNGL
jgi:multidrug efflux pump